MEKLINLRNQIIPCKTSVEKEEIAKVKEMQGRKYHHFDKIDEVKALLWDNVNFEAMLPKLRIPPEIL
jgi:hypothetical protein